MSMSDDKKGNYMTDELRDNRGRFKKGNPGYWLNKKRGPRSKETRKKQSEAQTGKHWQCSEKAKDNMKGHCGVYVRTKPAWNKDLSSDPSKENYDERVTNLAKNISKSLKGKTSWSKGLSGDPTKENYDPRVVKSIEGKSHIGEAQRRPEVRKKASKIQKVVQNRPEVKEKHRIANGIAWEKRTEGSGYPRNYLCPNFNFESIIIFKILDKVLHTESRYGGTKAGEKKIGRYFVDYFNEKYQLIIEWNEHWHYDNGHLWEYDIEKRKYVLSKYPDYNYIIIKQSNWFKKNSLTGEITNTIVDYILEELKLKNDVEEKEGEKSYAYRY